MKKVGLFALVLGVGFLIAQVPFPGGAGGGGASSGFGFNTSQVLGAPAGSITFSSILGTSKDLQLTLNGRGDTAALTVNIGLQFNGDTAANYEWQDTCNSAGSLTQTGCNATGATSIIACVIPGSTNTANFAGSCHIMIHNYAGTTFQKSITGVGGTRNATTPTMFSINIFGDWSSTAAITSIVLTPAAGNFIAGTTAILRGLN